MKRLELDINRCADCPYMDHFWHDDADGWCCKDEREIDDVSVLPDFCNLPDKEDKRDN